MVNTFVPFFTLGADVKMLKECGLATLLISGALLAVWTAGTSITNEIEGKTAMTLLSKPINRRQFILGKYMGILQGVLWLMVPLTLLFCLLIFYKVGHDQREASEAVSPMLETLTSRIAPIHRLLLLEVKCWLCGKQECHIDLIQSH